MFSILKCLKSCDTSFHIVCKRVVLQRKITIILGVVEDKVLVNIRVDLKGLNSGIVLG
jgi:hypothetical protein